VCRHARVLGVGQEYGQETGRKTMPARGSIVILIIHCFVRLITGPPRCWFPYFIFDTRGHESDDDFPESMADQAVQTLCVIFRFCYVHRPTNIRQTRRMFIKNLVKLRVSTFVQAEGGLIRVEIPNCTGFFDKRVLCLTDIYRSVFSSIRSCEG